jgi:ribosomal protein L19E
MNLRKKKELAARTLGIGKERIRFNLHRVGEIKEAITKQDIRDLVAQKAIFIIEPAGRQKTEPRGRRRAGSIRKKVRPGKKEYIRAARSLRKIVLTLKRQGKLDGEKIAKLRNEIRTRTIKTKAQLAERIGGISKL